MKHATRTAILSLAALATLGLAGFSAEGDDGQDPPKTTQKWVSTSYTFQNGQWVTVINCAPTGKNCPLPDPIQGN